MKLVGIPVSRGIAVGKAFLYVNKAPIISRDTILPQSVDCEIKKFDNAVKSSEREIEVIRDKILNSLGADEAEIFDAHISILNDTVFYVEVVKLIREENQNAAFAVEFVVKKFAEMYSNIPDEYLRERALDIKDVGNRIIRNIMGINTDTLSSINEEVIIVAEDLTPSDSAMLNRKYVLGFITRKGSTTSHTAIMAKSLGIPAVIGISDVMDKVKTNSTVIIDGLKGMVICEPDSNEVAYYRKRIKEYDDCKTELKKLAGLPAETIDGRFVQLLGNIGVPEDVDVVVENGGEGVGLYRTEFLYMDRNSLPCEDEQFEAYKEAALRLKGKPLIIRTLDIGGDKNLPYFSINSEENPFLGWRAIRICLERQDVFKTQLKAILRSGVFGNVSIMYPMISGVEEVREANRLLNVAKKELCTDGIEYDKNIKVGIMVEIPSAAVTADIIAKEVDFFSIGTNDLCQYSIAVDRMNPTVSHLYQPMHPAVLRMIKHVIESSHRFGKKTGMCGEMAGDPLTTAVLLGLGLDEFSMSSPSILTIKKLVRSISYADAQRLAKKVLEFSTTEQVIKEAKRFFLSLNISHIYLDADFK